MRKELEKKINQAIRLLQSISTDKGDIELSYSGGKDSDVILKLSQLAGIKVRVIYKSTSIDPPGTIAHAIKNGAEIIRPKKTFFQLVEQSGLPSRFVRFCCSKLKEYKICDIAIQGIRRSESRARYNRYQEPQICRIYNKNKNQRVSVFLPILEWTNEDVDEFIKAYNIQCAPVYYDEEGKFHVERRLGCMCCPLASRKKRLEEFHKHPKMIRLYVKACSKWFKKKRRSNGKFKNAIDMLCATVYFDSYAQFCENTYNIFGKFDWRKFLEKEFDINLQDIPYTYEEKSPIHDY